MVRPIEKTGQPQIQPRAAQSTILATCEGDSVRCCVSQRLKTWQGAADFHQQMSFIQSLVPKARIAFVLGFACNGCEIISSVDRSNIEGPGINDSGIDEPPHASGPDLPGLDASSGPLVKDPAMEESGIVMTEQLDASSVPDATPLALVDGAVDATPADAGVSADALVFAPAKVIYLTSMPKKANFGGVTGADGLCNTNPPVPGSYRALIADGTTRAVGLNWALAPGTKYVRADRVTVIGTTNSNATFTFPLSASIGTQALTLWTGLAANWATSDDNCNGWKGTVGFAATAGLADATNDESIMGVVENCGTLAGAFFACVEQ